LPVFLKSDILKTCCRVGHYGHSKAFAGSIGDSLMRTRPADIIKIKICTTKI